MRNRICLMLLIVCVAVLSGICGHTAPTGLNVISTADLLDRGSLALEYQHDGVRLFRSDCNEWALVQVGATDRIELGADTCFDGEEGVFWNAKVLLQKETVSRPALALGIQNVKKWSDHQPYVAAAKDIGDTRLHVGAVWIDGEGELMLGVERELFAPVTLAADYVTGRDNVAGVGVNVELPESFSLSVSRIFANDSDADDSWQVILSKEFTNLF